MTAAGTTSVKGVLYKSATGTPIEGAIVMIAEGSYEHPDIAAQTDDQGVFFVPNFQVPGPYNQLINYSNEAKKLKFKNKKESVFRITF